MRHEIRFLLGDQERRLTDVDPTMTVLNYLRLQERLAGTKEGCAEGDCGACTVVLGELEDGALRYRAANACIQFLPTLDGKQVLTVEHLKAVNGSLHPVQRAMVDRHASQCGFCTPGFVMSLLALQAEGGTMARDRVDDALAGNLCRCTGYGPIVEAAQSMGDAPMNTGGPLDGAAIARRLADLADDATIALDRPTGRYFAPAGIDALAELMIEHPDATLVAGATDVGLWVTKQHRRLDPVIYLGAVQELKKITETDGVLEIGAGVTYEAALEAIAKHSPDLGELIRRIGSRQIRNVGTIGGNIANGSPIGDMPPALIALDARLVLRRGDTVREIPLREYFIAHGRQDRRSGEFVAAVRVPLGDAAGLRCYKVSKRFDQDITAVLGAFNLMVEDGVVRAARICYGGMAAIPKRALNCEAALIGKRWDPATLAAGRTALAEDFQPLTDMRASADYRMKVARNLLTRLFVETTEPDMPTRLARPDSLGRRLAHG